jgi:hypothetical protein
LENTGHLSKFLIESFDSHKFLGNKAVHELQTPEKEELVHAIELVEQALVLIFNVPDKAQRLKEQIAKRISDSKSDDSLEA